MIVLLCTSRSGSSMIAGIFAAHGVNCGQTFQGSEYQTFENLELRRHVRDLAQRGGNEFLDWVKPLGGTEELVRRLGVDLFKCSVECWKPFEPFAKAVKIKRSVDSAARSVVSRGTDRDYDEAARIIRKRYAMMDSIPGPTVHSEKVIAGDFDELREAFAYCGLEFDEAKARRCIKPKMWHHK